MELDMLPNWTLDEATLAANLLVALHRLQGINVWTQHRPDGMPRGNFRGWSREDLAAAKDQFRMRATLTQSDRYLLEMLMEETKRRSEEADNDVPVLTVIR